MSEHTQAALICLLGPTASAKSSVAIAIAERLEVEIISVDSALIYKGMDIGTAKPTPQIRSRIPHHLIDILEPNEYYSAARFRNDALHAVAHIRKRHRIPLLVGGSMFYFNTLENGLSPMPATHSNTRAHLLAQYKSTHNLYNELRRIDPLSAARIHPNDTQRVLRALSVCLQSGRPMSEQQIAATRPAAAETLRYIALDYDDRTQLHRRIEQRFNSMLQQGLLDEVAKLMLRGDVGADSVAMRSIAYRQAWQHLVGQCSHSEMVQSALAASRQFAKRQLCWMRKMPLAARYAVDALSVEQLAEEIINKHLTPASSEVCHA